MLLFMFDVLLEGVVTLWKAFFARSVESEVVQWPPFCRKQLAGLFFIDVTTASPVQISAPSLLSRLLDDFSETKRNLGNLSERTELGNLRQHHVLNGCAWFYLVLCFSLQTGSNGPVYCIKQMLNPSLLPALFLQWLSLENCPPSIWRLRPKLMIT